MKPNKKEKKSNPKQEEDSLKSYKNKKSKPKGQFEASRGNKDGKPKKLTRKELAKLSNIDIRAAKKITNREVSDKDVGDKKMKVDKNKNGNKEKRCRNNDINAGENYKIKEPNADKVLKGKPGTLKGKKKIQLAKAAVSAGKSNNKTPGDLSEDSEESKPETYQVKKKKKKSNIPKEATVRQCFKYSIESNDDTNEDTIDPSDAKCKAKDEVACKKATEASSKDTSGLNHLDINQELTFIEKMENIEVMSKESSDSDSEDSIDEAVGDKDSKIVDSEDSKTNANSENESDVKIVKELENQLTFFQTEAEKITDPEVEYLGEMKSLNIPGNKMNEGDGRYGSELDTDKKDVLDRIKQEYEDKLKSTEDKFTHQSIQMDELKAQMATILQLLQKESSGDNRKENGENKDASKIDDKDGDEDLSELSKLIDSAPVQTSFLPDSISVSDDDLHDEIDLTATPSKSDKSGKRRELDQGNETTKKIKISTTGDEMLGQDVHLGLDSDIEEVEIDSKENDSSQKDSKDLDDKEANNDDKKAKKKAKIFKNQTKETRDSLEMYANNLNHINSPESRPLSLENQETPKHKGGASSSLESRMSNNLNYDLEFAPKSRFTGQRCPEFFDANLNKDLPAGIWEKYDWADPTAPMCSPDDINAFIEIHEIEHLRDQIAPWFCTIMPKNQFDRKGWTIMVNGDQYVSRARACTKQNYWRRHTLDSEDACLVCKKFLLSTFHVFMPVYRYEDPTKVDKQTIWRWQKSWLKICYLHFQRSEGVEYIPNRNPSFFGRSNPQPKKSLLNYKKNQAKMKLPSKADMNLPDDY